jgi:hypothetical protein
MLVILGLLIAVCAIAKSPEGQGRACDSSHKCKPGLQCVSQPDRKSTCELLCDTSATCPDEQRCVKIGSRRVCRPIYDGTF